MVEKTGHKAGRFGRRGGRRSREHWRLLREAYEDGATLEALADEAGLRAATLAARARTENWLSPRRAVRGLSRALDAEIASLEAAIAGGRLGDADKAARALEGLSRAAERLAALRAQGQARGSASMGGKPTDDSAETSVDAALNDDAALAELRGELERRLHRCAAALGASALSPGADGAGAAGAGNAAEP